MKYERPPSSPNQEPVDISHAVLHYRDHSKRKSPYWELRLVPIDPHQQVPGVMVMHFGDPDKDREQAHDIFLDWVRKFLGQSKHVVLSDLEVGPVRLVELLDALNKEALIQATISIHMDYGNQESNPNLPVVWAVSVLAIDTDGDKVQWVKSFTPNEEGREQAWEYIKSLPQPKIPERDTTQEE